MEVTIVNPLAGKYMKVDFYMSLLYLATHLHRNGYKVNVVDCQVEDDYKSKVRKLVKRSDVFGFSVMTVQVKSALELSDLIKKEDPEIPIVWGGIHPSIHPRETLGDKSVDYVIRGEGEHTFVELCRHLQGKMPIGKIKGLVYNKNGQIRMNPERPFLDLNDLSPPEWGLMKMERYIENFKVAGVNYGRSLPVHSGRGCSYRCAFCISAKRWRPLTAENVLKETLHLKGEYGLDFIVYVDENFFVNRERVMKLCRGLIRERAGLGWIANCRVNYFNRNHVNGELLGIIRKAGCRILGMGIESGSQRMLDIMKKDIKVEQVIPAIRACRKTGIVPLCSFMIGLPKEKRDDMDRTLDMIMKIRSVSNDAVILGPQVFRPYPGCELYEMIKDSFNEPKSLRGWSEIDLTGGYTRTKHLGWVEEPGYVDNAGFYVDRATFTPEKTWRKIVEYPLKRVSEFRLRHKFFWFPVERRLFQIGQHLYYGRSTRPE